MKINKIQTALITALAACKLDQDVEWLVTMDVETNKPMSCDYIGALLLAQKTKADPANFDNQDMTNPYFSGVADMTPKNLVTALCLRDDKGTLLKPWKVGKATHASLNAANDAGVSFKDMSKYIKANSDNVFITPEERDLLDNPPKVKKQKAKVVPIKSAKKKPAAKKKAPAKKKVSASKKAPAKKKPVTKVPVKKPSKAGKKPSARGSSIPADVQAFMKG